MAAKQGLSAQISQASEDAKRAVLQRTNLSSSLWFSNLNTTCTIKSAPPRTPDVLTMLASKSGWLLKRNEQHVWQNRWCCVVPHTFLYYFDACPAGIGDQNGLPPTSGPGGGFGSGPGGSHSSYHGGGTPSHQSYGQQTLTPKQQDQLNKAVRQGYGKRGAAKSQQPRSSLYHVLGTGGPAAAATPVAIGGDDEAGLTAAGGASTNAALQPAGIIDLECYTVIHRNSQNELLLELAGDDTVNPDLRSFYFCANSDEEGEAWTQALLSQRHSSLIDERDAYQQVCDGFAQQLQVLHSDLDNAQRQSEQQQEELYRVRSQMEDTRRNCWRLVQDTLERTDGISSVASNVSSGVPAAKKAYRTDLETIQSQDLGLLSAVQLLCDYTRVLEETVSDCTEKTTNLEKKLEQAQEGDQSKVKQLERELERFQLEMNQQQQNWQSQLETLQQKYLQSQKECQDVQKELASQRLEMTMYQSATRTKMSELQGHKKILKKEVIELRQKLEEVNSELDLQKHKESSSKLEVATERQKSQMLERYVEKMESQVKVQQNMMEMMSLSASVAGGSIAPGDYPPLHVPGSPAIRSKSYASMPARGFADIIVNTPNSVRHEEDDEFDEHPRMGGVDRLPDDLDHPAMDHIPHHLQDPSPSSKKSSSRRAMNDDDNKSHMSELTEDRTQKQFDAAFFFQQQHSSALAASAAAAAAASSRQQISPRGGGNGPPAIIGVADLEGDAPADGDRNESNGTSPSTPKLDTIMVSHSSARSRPRNELPPSYINNNEGFVGGTPGSNGGRNTTPRGDAGSVSSLGSGRKKLSVAQRARMEADQHSTPVRVRMNSNSTTPSRGGNDKPIRSMSVGRGEGSLTVNNAHIHKRYQSPHRLQGSSNNSQSSGFLSNLGRRLEAAIDNSVFGAEDSDDDSDSSGSSSDDNTENRKGAGGGTLQEEKKMSESGSVASSAVSPILAAMS